MTDKFNLIYRGHMPDLLCCDTILRRMQNGEWVVVMLSGGHMEPLPENGVYIMRSKDEGMTWTEPARLFNGTGKTFVPTELMVVDGKCTLFIISHDGRFHDWENHFSVSTDNGYTWSKPEPFLPCFRNTAIRTLHIMKNGEMVLPYQHYEIDPAEYARDKDKNKYFFDNAITIRPVNGVLTSNDMGENWNCHQGATVDCGHWIWAENNVAELRNGTLSMLTRVDGSGTLYRADSYDGGRTWNNGDNGIKTDDVARMYPTDIPNPGSKFRIFNLKDGRIALVHNPALARENCMAGRNPLSIWISDDDMKTWPVKRDLVTFPGQLSYPDGFADEDEGYIHFAFDYNRHDAIYVGAAING
ncbi:MAG: exo-alpha-sialidase [Saccharofermentanales bacterium]